MRLWPKKQRKKAKKKMAIVKEDCDSFDIMPLEEANNAGKRVYQTTKIDKFIASFSEVRIRKLYLTCVPVHSKY